MQIPSTDRELRAYYRAARVGLWFVEQRRPSGRRFGPQADARFRALAGSLGASARLELLVRDADAEWPGAFGPRTVFSLSQVAEDDAFGAQWAGFWGGEAESGVGVGFGVEAEELWRSALPQVNDPAAAFTAMAAAWDLSLAAPDAAIANTLAELDPAQPLWLAGPRAIAQAAEHFARHETLDWSAQVTCVATPFGQRQLAAFGAAVADTRNPARVLTADAAKEALAADAPRKALIADAPQKALSARAIRILTTADAAPEDRAVLLAQAAEG